ncbi:MAG TPA: GntR family transcriptional regulator [Thermomicrobiaceae bacterium]|nr:GntR family transcriptional regulator [Thermomicrobiaceae bacterium]
MSALELIDQIREELNPAERTPLYEQIAGQLRRAIEAGRLTPGEPIPPEPELARSLGVSRQTVNQALTSLAQRGLLTRRRGVGTFVAEPFIEQPLDGLYTFIRTLTAQGRQPSSRILGYRLTVEEEASRLLTGRGDGLIQEISRLRLVDGEPFVLETIFIAAACGERIAPARLANEPLYDLMRDLCGIDITGAEETLRPVTLEPREAALLGLTTGEPAFLVERTGFSGDDVIELRRSIVRGDRYRYRVWLSTANLDHP